MSGPQARLKQKISSECSQNVIGTFHEIYKLGIPILWYTNYEITHRLLLAEVLLDPQNISNAQMYISKRFFSYRRFTIEIVWDQKSE